MEKTTNVLKTGYSRIFWAVLAVVFCALPCSADLIEVSENTNSPYILDTEETNWILVYNGGILQLKPGGYTYDSSEEAGIDVYDGTLEIYGSHTWTESDEPAVANPEATVTLFTDSISSIVLETLTGPDAELVGTTITVDAANGWWGKLTWSYEGETYSLTILTYADISVEVVGGPPEPEPITIDIKPGSDDNTINLGSHGVVPVAILSDADFDATLVDPENVFLAGSGVRVRGKGNKYLASQEDVNGDCLPDLVVKIETENLELDETSGEAILTIVDENGETQYQGSDMITIVPPE